MVVADKLRISQVISNLVDNSVNFIMDSKKGMITITIEGHYNCRYRLSLEMWGL